MAKDPAVLFYTQDFLQGTSLFSAAQTGHYIKLLCHQQQSKNGSLSIDDIKKIMAKDFDKHWLHIAHKFEADGNGFFNERMRLEIERRKKNSSRQRDIALKRWDKNGISSGSAMAMPFIETETEKEEERSVRKGKSEKWNSRPAEAEYDLPLTDHETQTCIEYIFRLKQTELSPSRLNDFWHAFKIQQFTGGKFYPERSRCIDHFRNWLKGQDLATKPLETKINGRKQNIQDERTRKILEEAERARK
jgi:uncharacterized protein YdaU (DUF1376 family)